MGDGIDGGSAGGYSSTKNLEEDNMGGGVDLSGGFGETIRYGMNEAQRDLVGPTFEDYVQAYQGLKRIYVWGDEEDDLRYQVAVDVVEGVTVEDEAIEVTAAHRELLHGAPGLGVYFNRILTAEEAEAAAQKLFDENPGLYDKPEGLHGGLVQLLPSVEEVVTTEAPTHLSDYGWGIAEEPAQASGQ